MWWDFSVCQTKLLCFNPQERFLPIVFQQIHRVATADVSCIMWRSSPQKTQKTRVSMDCVCVFMMFHDLCFYQMDFCLLFFWCFNTALSFLRFKPASSSLNIKTHHSSSFAPSCALNTHRMNIPSEECDGVQISSSSFMTYRVSFLLLHAPRAFKGLVLMIFREWRNCTILA